jgi:hypothetical protein
MIDFFTAVRTSNPRRRNQMMKSRGEGSKELLKNSRI